MVTSNQKNCVVADTSLEASIPVQLDGEESVLDCIDVPYTGVRCLNVSLSFQKHHIMATTPEVSLKLALCITETKASPEDYVTISQSPLHM